MARTMRAALLLLALAAPAEGFGVCPAGGSVRLHPTLRRAHLTATALISRGAPAPAGPDPYKLVANDLDTIKSSIKKVLSDNRGGSGALQSNEVLTMAAREFMQRKGKSFRPMLVLLIGRATDPDFSIGPRHYKLAVISEMIHTASLIHADVLEEGEVDTTQGTLVHQEVNVDVGNKVCILAGDFLLAKAAVELSLLDCSEVTEIVARGLESICEGGMLSYDSSPDSGFDDAPPSLDQHLHILQRQIGQLIANSCQCSAILSGHAADSTTAQACLTFGEGLAMAQQLVGEAEEMEQLLKKCRRAPRKWPSQLPPSAPLLYAADKYPDIKPIIRKGFGSTADAKRVISALDKCDAVRHTHEMATTHAQEAAEALQLLPNSATRTALVVLCHKVLAGAPIK